MIIGVAGPYSADTEEKRKANFDAMNEAAAKLLEMGHIPLIGVNAALPVVKKANVEDKYKAVMDISLAVIDKCEAILIIGESKGANMERDLAAGKGLPVYYSVEEVPKVHGGKMKYKLDKEENDILKSFESDEWNAVNDSDSVVKDHVLYAKSASDNSNFKIGITQEDMSVIEAKAKEAEVAYDKLISDVIHNYALGNFIEKQG